MAYGKNKKLAKGGKKGQKKKQLDPFLKKVWYDVKAPTYLKTNKPKVGKTVVTKTQGLKSETDGLKGRICEFNVADICPNNAEDGHKKIKLEVQDLQGKACLTEFHGMSITRDKMCALIKKKHTLVETVVDCPTSDGYIARVSVIAFTKEARDKQGNVTQVKVFTYAQSGQIRKIRKKITQLLQEEISPAPMKNLVSNLLLDNLEQKIKAETSRIFPLEPVHIYKVKLVKKPKFDVSKLWESHDKEEDVGTGVSVAEDTEAKNLLTA